MSVDPLRLGGIALAPQARADMGFWKTPLARMAPLATTCPGALRTYPLEGRCLSARTAWPPTRSTKSSASSSTDDRWLPSGPCLWSPLPDAPAVVFQQPLGHECSAAPSTARKIAREPDVAQCRSLPRSWHRSEREMPTWHVFWWKVTGAAALVQDVIIRSQGRSRAASVVR